MNGKLDGNAIKVKNKLTTATKILKRLLTEADETTKEVELAEKYINDIIAACTNVKQKAEELIAAIEAEEKQEESRGNTNTKKIKSILKCLKHYVLFFVNLFFYFLMICVW